jgi:hypothetical protein
MAYLEGATELEAGLEGTAGLAGSGRQLLDGEEEGHTLATGQLDSGGGVVDAVLLLELDLAAFPDRDLAGNTIKGVRLAGHQLGVDERLGGLPALVRHFLLHLVKGGKGREGGREGKE